MKPLARLALLFGVIFALAPSSFAAVEGKDLFTGKSVELKSGPKGSVLIFMSARCPCSDSHVPVVKKLSTEFPEFSFAVVHANADEPVEEAKTYFKEAAFLFPVINDSEGKLSDQFKALKTPHAFLLDAQGKILYKGGVTSSNNAARADKHFLQDALAEVNSGKTVTVANGRTLGCVIARGKNGK